MGGYVGPTHSDETCSPVVCIVTLTLAPPRGRTAADVEPHSCGLLCARAGRIVSFAVCIYIYTQKREKTWSLTGSNGRSEPLSVAAVTLYFVGEDEAKDFYRLHAPASVFILRSGCHTPLGDVSQGGDRPSLGSHAR